MSVTEEKIQEFDRNFLEFMNKTENFELTINEMYEDLLDEVLMGFVFEVHRTIKTGCSDVEEGIPDGESYTIVDLPGLDVFGQHPIKKFQECSCPNCDRGVAACRFATHLEKCMGMGRNSSRIASRRIANSTRDTLSSFAGVISDDDDDADWSLSNDKRKRRKDRNNFKKSKQSKQRIGDNSEMQTSNENSPSNYENMSVDDKRALLMQICGVISEHTKKLCTRSMRCPQHSDDQRKEIRANIEFTDSTNMSVDVDVYDGENDGQHLRDALTRWDPEGSNQTSPSDTGFTSLNIVMNKKRDSKNKGKGKGSKRDRGSPISQGD